MHVARHRIASGAHTIICVRKSFPQRLRLWKAPTDPAIKGREILKDTRVVGMRSSIDSHVVVPTVPMLFVSDLQHLYLALHERLTPLVRDRIVFEISLEIGSQVPIDARGRVRQRDRVVVPHTGRELSTQCDVRGAARVATLTTLILCLDGDRWPASAEQGTNQNIISIGLGYLCRVRLKFNVKLK